MSDTTTIDPETLTASQQARRDRILEAAVELATRGGFDGVQMRDVADQAEVALGTLYRYFPSKVHLLVAVMQRQSSGMRSGMARRPPDGATAEERILSVLRRATRALERSPRLTEAMFRALMFADISAARQVDTVNGDTQMLILGAMIQDDREPTTDEVEIARVVSSVWQSSILTWLTGRLSSTDMYRNLETACRLLLRDHD